MIDQGNLINSPQQVIQKSDYDRDWSSQEWKSEVTAHDRAANIQARSFVARTPGDIGKNDQLKERQKWSHEKPKLENARKLRGICFTRDEWNHLLCLFNISHFSPTVCSAAMAKRSQQDSGQERVTAKSKPMMNLIARTPSFVSSSTSVTPGKRY